VSDIKLSAVVIAQNAASIIERCLNSLQFADEIVVVDALSHDGTQDIARRCGARVVSNRWPGFAKQSQFAIDQAKGEWVFRCDTDEVVSDELATEIRETIAQSTAADGYRVRRKNQFLGEWILVGPWADDVKTRLYKNGRAKVSQVSVHEGEIVDGTVRTLENELLHYTHPTVAESIQRLNWYTTLEAGDRAGRRRITLIDPIVPPIGVFINYYFRRGCWRAGMHGFLLSAITAMYKSILYVKIYWLQRSSRAKKANGITPVPEKTQEG
jgi:glycosyltransferase involved in cell wall biosynthesis